MDICERRAKKRPFWLDFLDVPFVRHVKEVEPKRGFLPFVGMSMPTPGWGQHDIAGRHINPLTVHHGIDIIASIEHETQGSRCVPGERAVSPGWIIW